MNSFIKDLKWASIKLIKIGLIIGAIITVISLLFVLYWNSQCPNIDCPSYPNLSSEWFPYKEKQQLIFYNENQKDTLIVQEYDAIKDETYSSCVHSIDCQEQVKIKLISSGNTTIITMQNYKNSYAGFNLEINDSLTREKNIFSEVVQDGKKYETLLFQDFIIIKNIGITSYERNGKVWKLLD